MTNLPQDILLANQSIQLTVIDDDGHSATLRLKDRTGTGLALFTIGVIYNIKGERVLLILRHQDGSVRVFSDGSEILSNNCESDENISSVENAWIILNSPK